MNTNKEVEESNCTYVMFLEVQSSVGKSYVMFSTLFAALADTFYYIETAARIRQQQQQQNKTKLS